MTHITSNWAEKGFKEKRQKWGKIAENCGLNIELWSRGMDRYLK
jgi:hypothetical protein